MYKVYFEIKLSMKEIPEAATQYELAKIAIEILNKIERQLNWGGTLTLKVNILYIVPLTLEGNIIKGTIDNVWVPRINIDGHKLRLVVEKKDEVLNT